jgi:hypothetical protein
LIIQPTNYYNYAFADDELWSAYSLTAGHAGDSVVGYAPRDSEIDRRLRKLLEGCGMHPVTLALAAVDGSEKHGQFQIVKLLGEGFVVPQEDAPSSAAKGDKREANDAR